MSYALILTHEWQIFWETFHGNFVYSHSFCQKSPERKWPKKYFLHFILMSGPGIVPGLYVYANTLLTRTRRLYDVFKILWFWRVNNTWLLNEIFQKTKLKFLKFTTNNCSWISHRLLNETLLKYAFREAVFVFLYEYRVYTFLFDCLKLYVCGLPWVYLDYILQYLNCACFEMNMSCVDNKCLS